MSSSSSPRSERIGTRFSTPAPELDDHRPRLLAQARIPEIPVLGIQLPTPSPRLNALDRNDLLQVNEALRDADYPNPIARDFEHVIVDDDRDHEPNEIAQSSAPRGSARKRRLTNRQVRSPNIERTDCSRDSSSSRSSSPANSVEAFAEPRRRQRATTVDSRAPSFIENLRTRGYSGGTAQRRPTLTSLSLPPPLNAQTDERVEVDVTFPINEEPGKTYRIDYEELEEFVALHEQGLIPEESLQGQTPELDGEQGKPRYGSVVTKPLEHPSNESSPDLNEKSFGSKNLTGVEEPRERFIFFSSEYQGIMAAHRLGDFTKNGTSFRDMFEVGPDGGVWWLDVQSPTKAELEVIAKAFKIHRLTREDIETQESREKVELFPQYYFVCFRSFNPDSKSDDFLEPVHVYIIVCGDGVLTFSHSPTPHARNVRKRIGALKDFLSLGPDYICYAMIDDIVDCFAPVIHEAELESEDIEDQVFTTREEDFLALLRAIGGCRKKVLNMMRLLGGKADVIKGFAKRCNESYSMTPRGDIGLYLGDIQDHVVTMMSNLVHVEKMLSRSHANYLAQLNVDNILKGNASNKALAKISVVATIFVPLNLLCGLFGMNVPVPGRETSGLGWFFGIVGVILGFTTVCLLVAKKLRAI